MVGTNPTPAGDVSRAVARWQALRNGGNSYGSDRMAATLRELGLAHVAQHPTVPGGPVLVVGRRP